MRILLITISLVLVLGNLIQLAFNGTSCSGPVLIAAETKDHVVEALDFCTLNDQNYSTLIVNTTLQRVLKGEYATLTIFNLTTLYIKTEMCVPDMWSTYHCENKRTFVKSFNNSECVGDSTQYSFDSDCVIFQ
jgi:hypothetical protein